MDINKEFIKIKATIGEMEEHNQALWCLLSLCRVNQPFLILSELDECSELKCFQEFLETCKQATLNGKPATFDSYIEMLKHASCVCAGMYFTENGEADYLPAEKDKSETELAGGFIPAYFGNLIAAIGQLLDCFPRIKDAGNGAEVIMGATFEDYFYDKYGANDPPEVLQEIERIWNDHQFILNQPSQSEIESKMEEYKTIQVWKG